MSNENNGLNYKQTREVEKIVDNKMSQQSFFDNFRKMFEHIQFTQMVKDKVDIVVPQAGDEWVKKNLRLETESITNNYMRNNFLSFFRKEVSENKEIQGFVSQHLKEVEDKVNVTAKKSVDKIVDTSSKFNPIFDSHLSILTQRNKITLDEQSNKIREGLDSMRRVELENQQLRKRTTALEKSYNVVAGVSTISMIGVLGIIIYSFGNK